LEFVHSNVHNGDTTTPELDLCRELGTTGGLGSIEIFGLVDIAVDAFVDVGGARLPHAHDTTNRNHNRCGRAFDNPNPETRASASVEIVSCSRWLKPARRLPLRFQMNDDEYLVLEMLTIVPAAGFFVRGQIHAHDQLSMQ